MPVSANDPPDPFIPEERLTLYKPFGPLAPLAAGSYYISVLAVYPQFQGKGIGSKLMNLGRSHAVQRGFSKLSLPSFDDAPVVAFYQRLGFTVAGRSPLVEHELMQFSGDLLLMTRSI